MHFLSNVETFFSKGKHILPKIPKGTVWLMIPNKDSGRPQADFLGLWKSCAIEWLSNVWHSVSPCCGTAYMRHVFLSTRLLSDPQKCVYIGNNAFWTNLERPPVDCLSWYIGQIFQISLYMCKQFVANTLLTNAYCFPPTMSFNRHHHWDIYQCLPCCCHGIKHQLNWEGPRSIQHWLLHFAE